MDNIYAAGTIEKLRGEIERLTERCAAYKGQVEAGAHEIERLREVLREIAVYGTCTDIDTSAMARKALGVHEQITTEGK